VHGNEEQSGLGHFLYLTKLVGPILAEGSVVVCEGSTDSPLGATFKDATNANCFSVADK